MEDVMQSALKSPMPIQLPKTLVTGEPVSWTPPEANPNSRGISKIRIQSTLPFPLSDLFSLVENHQNYPDSCRQLAEFFKVQCGHYPLERLVLEALQARFPRVWMERFLFILLEVEASDWQTAAYVLQFRHLKRLLLRVERQKPLNAVETNLAHEIIQSLGLSSFTDLNPFCHHANEIFKLMQAGRIPVSGDLGLLVYLIHSEALAIGERKHWLELDLGIGDLDSLSRLTPLLKHLEQRMHKALEMAKRLGGYGPILDATMGIEEQLGPFFYAHFKQAISKLPELLEFKETLELQRAKRIPTADLIALTTLTRWVLEARGHTGGPLEWIRMALESYDQGHFRLDIEGRYSAVEVLLGEAKTERDGNYVLGNFGENPYSPWIARDGLTRPYRSANPDRIPPDLRSTILANIHNDTILLKLLEHSKVYMSPGLIEMIVEGNRSPFVHQQIAARRELHTGVINGRVPIALLRSPVDIPAALLRNLIHPQHVSFTDMKSLYRAREELRREVVAELHRFLTLAYAS